MADDVRQGALKLLELINDKAGGRMDIEVWPEDQMAAAAGLGYRGSRHYDIAIRVLLDEGALEVATETNALLSGVAGDIFYITERGQELLRQRR
jgi:DNA polymerase/3'-5' exonuclease PolX